MQKYIRILSGISFIEGLIAFIWLASLPTNGRIFSPVRIGSLFGILAISVGWLFVYFQRAPTVRIIQALVNWKSKISLACFCIYVPLLVLSVGMQQVVWSRFGEAIYARLTPIVVWSAILSIQVGLFTLLAKADQDEITETLSPLWKPAGILLACFVLVWGFISVTKIGITTDIVGLSWGPPGTPVTFSQVFVVFTISVCLGVLLLLINPRITFAQQKRLLDIIIFTGLWIFAVFMWWQQPMIQSHFAPIPMAPNFEYYPNSDAAIFDRFSYQLLYGTSFNTQLVRRPLYVGMLALYHKISGSTYEGTILLQILTLAFIPALIYLLTTKLSNRLAGLLTGGLIVLREANAIQLSGEIAASHAKLMMSDLVTMLGVAAILYVAVTALIKHDRHPWLLAILGACMGLTILVRAQTLILLPPILLLFILARKPFKTGLRETLIIFLGFILILSPLIWRNWNLTGTFVLDDRGEERLLARNYSSNPISLPPPLANETEKEFSKRLRKEIIAYTSTHPKDVLFFISNHFFHNMADSAVYVAPHYSSDSPDTLLSRVPFWGTWEGNLPQATGGFLFINLAIMAMGISIAQHQNKIAGWLPFVVFIIYSSGNALVRSSGWRFSLPVDWIILMYYCIALAYIPSRIGTLLRLETASLPNHESETHTQHSFVMPVVFSLLFLMGASVPIAERLIPNRDFGNLTAQAMETFDKTKTLSTSEIDAFLQQKDAVLFSGIALYPRYYRPDSRIYLGNTPVDYSYLHFWIISNGDEQVVLPLQNVPDGIPHTSTVSVLGCRNKDYILAWAVLIHSQPEQILIQAPRSSLSCPLAEPN